MWQQKKVEETELFQREMEEVMGKQNVIALAICNFGCVSNYLGERGRLLNFEKGSRDGSR